MMSLPVSFAAGCVAIHDRGGPVVKTAVGILGALLVAASPALAQDVTGSLQGRVRSAEDVPLAGAQVTVHGPNLLGSRSAVTDRGGVFQLLAVPVGSYEVRIELLGHQPAVYQDVAVRLAQTTTLSDIRLQVEAIELPSLIVWGERPVIDLTTTVIGAGIESEFFETLPSDRDYRSILAQLPQANTSFYGDEANIGGATGLENMYYIDGVNVTDPGFNFNDFGGTAGMGLPYNFIQAIDLKEGGYQAEFGNTLGGIVNVITYSGGNQFRAEGFGYFSGSGLSGDARPGAADIVPQDFTTWDVGVSLGGPIARDRLWYSAAYNPKFTSQNIDIPGAGVHQDELTTHQFAGKLTWQISDRSEATFTVLGDPSVHHIASPALASGEPFTSVVNPDPLLGFEEQGGTSLSLAGQTMFSQNLLLEGTLYRYSRRSNLTGDTEIGRAEPLLNDLDVLSLSGGLREDNDRNSSRTGFRVAATRFAGNHTLKAGVEYQDNRSKARLSFKTPGSMRRFSQTQLDTAGMSVTDTVYLALVADLDNTVHNRVPTVYVQDSWLIGTRWRLNAGLRWDGQYLSGPAESQSITDQFQPRLGLIFQPGTLGTQKIFGSYGRYYQQFTTAWAAQLFGGFDNRLLTYVNVDPRVFPDSIAGEFVATEPCCAGSPSVDGLKGEGTDEFVLGYERAVGSHLLLNIQGIRRVLRAAVGTGLDANTELFVLGNLGEGDIDFIPQAKRTYTALQLTAGWLSPRLNVTGSYVLSRSEGNYTGQFDSDAGMTNPGNFLSLQLESQGTNSTGLLPNDRTHAFKLSGSYRFDFGLDLGTFFVWQSGTPLNEFGATGLFRPIFLVERGSAGRTPSIWDLNLRFAYNLRGLVRTGPSSRIVLDVLHLGSQRSPVWVDQQKFLAVDPAQANFLSSYEELVAAQSIPNPDFGAPLRNQLPMMVRLGIVVGF
jgi:hypothetical protein